MTALTVPPVTPVSFSGIIAFMWIGIFLLMGMYLRAKVPFFRRYLISSCIIGGAIGLFLTASGFVEFTGFAPASNTYQVIVYHLFNLTFVFLGLKLSPPKKSANSPGLLRSSGYYISNSVGLTNLVIAVGILATIITSAIGLSEGPRSLGALVGIGFAQGPGQALTLGLIWENASNFLGMPDFGLASGALGFAAAIVLGIPLMNIIARKKKITMLTSPSPEEGCGYYDECTELEEAGKMTTSSNSIDVFTWHIALGMTGYFIATAISVALFMILPQQLKSFVWVLYFLIANMSGMLVRGILTKAGKSHLLCNGVNSRINNALVDFLVCGTFVSITIGNMSQYILPFVFTAVMVALFIILAVWLVTSKVKEEGPEMFAFMFGTLTGTPSTGFVLLRMIDPNGFSRVPTYMAVGNLFVLPNAILSTFGKNMEVILGYSPWLMCALFVAMAAFWLILAHTIFRLPTNKTAWQSDE